MTQSRNESRTYTLPQPQSQGSTKSTPTYRKKMNQVQPKLVDSVKAPAHKKNSNISDLNKQQHQQPNRAFILSGCDLYSMSI
ncbi:hypothetical protein YC2023_070735 [Brassica napus]